MKQTFLSDWQDAVGTSIFIRYYSMIKIIKLLKLRVVPSLLDQVFELINQRIG